MVGCDVYYQGVTGFTWGVHQLGRFSSGVKRRRLSDLSRRVLGLVTNGTHVPFLRMTETYGISNTTVRRHVRGLAGLNVLGNSRCIVSPRGVKCRAYTCVNVCLGSPRSFSSIAGTLRTVPRIMRYRFAAKGCSVFVGVCTGGGRRLLDVVRSGLRPLKLTHARALVSFRRTVGQRVPVVISMRSRSWWIMVIIFCTFAWSAGTCRREYFSSTK